MRAHLVCCQCGLYISTQVSCTVTCCVWHLCCCRGSFELQTETYSLLINSSQDMTEEKLQSLLESTLTEHSQRCSHSPEFTVTSGMEEEASLLMSCSVSVNVRFLERISAWIHVCYMGRNHKSVDPCGLCGCFFTKFLGDGFTFDQQ